MARNTIATTRRSAIVLSGLGAVGTALIRLLRDRRDQLRGYGLELVVVGAVDSRGAAVNAAGLDLDDLLSTKSHGGSVSEGAYGQPRMTVADVLAHLKGKADLLVEAGPGDLRTGGAGLVAVRDARSRGLDVVLANKAPLALAWDELTSTRPRLRYSGCVGGALPTVDLARRVLSASSPTRVETALNGTSQLVLRLMESGLRFEAAVAQAQAQGIAEPDPSFDIDGWDSAVKLLILANAVLGQTFTLADVEVTGIREVTPARLASTRAQGEAIVLLGKAIPDPKRGWHLSVQPTSLPLTHPLARMDPEEMGLVLHTDVAGRLAATTLEPDAGPTASAVLRDIVDLLGLDDPDACSRR